MSEVMNCPLTVTLQSKMGRIRGEQWWLRNDALLLKFHHQGLGDGGSGLRRGRFPLLARLTC